MVGTSSTGISGWPGLLIVYEDENSKALHEFVSVKTKEWNSIVFMDDGQETIRYVLEERSSGSPKIRVAEIRLNRNRQR